MSCSWLDFSNIFPVHCLQDAETDGSEDEKETSPPTLSHHDISEIIPGFLYISDFQTSCNRTKLRRKNIGAILSVVKKISPHPLKDEYIFKALEMPDSPNQDIFLIINQTHSFIEEARKNGYSVLVQCESGLTRSPTIAITYLMKHQHMSLLQAYVFVKEKRKMVCPTTYLAYHLVRYEVFISGVQSPFLAEYIRETFHLESTPISVVEDAVAKAGNDIMGALKILMQPLMCDAPYFSRVEPHAV